MPSFQRVIIETPITATDFKSVCDLAPGQLPALQNFQNYVGAVSGGSQSAKLSFQVGAVKATGTIVQASTGAANGQTCTIFGVTFTALTSGHVAAAATWDRSDTVATSATNLAAAINEYVAFNGIVTALASSGTVTVTAVVPGKIGNGLYMVNVNLANTTITTLAGGTDGTAYALDLL